MNRHGRLIDADALIAKCGDWYCEEGTEEGFIGVIKHLIDAQPTIEPERKTGRWIKVNGKTAINCSACYHCSWSLSFEDTVKRFKFCPNCGADMRGEQDEPSD